MIGERGIRLDASIVVLPLKINPERESIQNQHRICFAGKCWSEIYVLPWSPKPRSLPFNLCDNSSKFNLLVCAFSLSLSLSAHAELVAFHPRNRDCFLKHHAIPQVF